MRIWHPIPVYCLDEKRLKGEHAELHAIWSIITTSKRGYRLHPETQRWIGHLAALAHRHDLLVAELTLRGIIEHKSPLYGVERFARPPVCYPPLIEPVIDMRAKLAAKIQASINTSVYG
jgi:hypothetical protein